MEKKFNNLTEIAATLLADYQTNYFQLREINSHLENLDQLSNESIRNAITDAQRQMLAFLVNTAENKSAEAQQDVIDLTTLLRKYLRNTGISTSCILMVGLLLKTSITSQLSLAAITAGLYTTRTLSASMFTLKPYSAISKNWIFFKPETGCANLHKKPATTKWTHLSFHKGSMSN